MLSLLLPLTGFAATKGSGDGREAEGTFSGPRECDRTAVRFRPAVAKKGAVFEAGAGRCLPGGRVLVTADLVANQNYVELERAESGDKTAANVVVVDYESNLALLEPTDKKFLDGLTPLQLALDTVVGDRLAALQLESTGALVLTEGLVTTIQMTRYPAGPRPVPHLSREHVAAISRQQLHRAAGQEQQARRAPPAVMISAPRSSMRFRRRSSRIS